MNTVKAGSSEAQSHQAPVSPDDRPCPTCGLWHYNACPFLWGGRVEYYGPDVNLNTDEES